MQFNQPDSIIPDSYNSLDWNRYAYARHNPISYTDPSGHRPCDDEFGECRQQKKSSQNIDLPIDQETNDGQQSNTPQVIRLRDGTVVIIMPPGSKSTLQRPNWSRRLGIGFGIAGFMFDLGEMATIFDLLPGDEDAAALADVGVTYLSSAFGGDSYLFERPDSSLPYMVTINQDVIVTAGDAGIAILGKLGASAVAGPVGYLVGEGTDVVTTGASLVYDGNRVFGDLKNYVSTGVAVTSTDQINSGDNVILIWPD